MCLYRVLWFHTKKTSQKSRAASLGPTSGASISKLTFEIEKTWNINFFINAFESISLLDSVHAWQKQEDTVKSIIGCKAWRQCVIMCTVRKLRGTRYWDFKYSMYTKNKYNWQIFNHSYTAIDSIMIQFPMQISESIHNCSAHQRGIWPMKNDKTPKDGCGWKVTIAQLQIANCGRLLSLSSSSQEYFIAATETHFCAIEVIIMRQTKSCDGTLINSATGSKLK